MLTPELHTTPRCCAFSSPPLPSTPTPFDLLSAADASASKARMVSRPAAPLALQQPWPRADAHILSPVSD